MTSALSDDVDAVLLVVDHLFEAPQLALEDATAMQGALFDFVDHVNHHTP
jgi:hypothetical protein